MAWDKVRFYSVFLKFLVSYVFKRVYQRLAASVHRFTYTNVQSAKNVVVLGGSFAGVELARRLSESLPTGFRVILVEKNSHLNYSFNFPRYSVLQGHERQAFIPYDGITRGAPTGIFRQVRDTAECITEEAIYLKSGDKIPYAYLAIATGSWQPSPARLESIGREDACLELQRIQASIKATHSIAVIGGGAVGIELAADIKSFRPEKDVTLIHSRGQLLPRFGWRLHKHVLEHLNELNIRTLLRSRPQIVGIEEQEENKKTSKRMLKFPDGHFEEYDLILPCTGQSPNSAVLMELAPESVSCKTGRILVDRTLQIATLGSTYKHIFALGDVAETRGPQMARAGFFQAEIVRDNIISLIKGSSPRKTYVPQVEIEGAIKLTLGKTHWVMYSMDADGTDMLIQGNGGQEDLNIERAWKMYGAEMER